MKQTMNSAAVPRTQLFSLSDGAVVVQWTDTRVQDIATGKYREYSAREFGRRLDEDELARLKERQIIEHYNAAYVWLYALPEHGRFDDLHTLEGKANARRYFYLNTTLSADYLDEMRAYMQAQGLSAMGAEAVERDGIVAIVGERGMLFTRLEDAEAAQAHVQMNAPDALQGVTVAFSDLPTFTPSNDSADADEWIDLDALIAGQDMDINTHAQSDS